jgi:hypothetical protein
MDKRVSAVQDKYQDALKALEKEVQKRADAAK